MVEELLNTWKDNIMSKKKKEQNHHHLVFVYGSLKRGFGNHRVYLQDTKGTVFLGGHKTKQQVFLMESLGAFPAVCDKGFYKIEGELYKVTGHTLSRLDHLESNGRFYQRELIELEDGTIAWMYLILDYSPIGGGIHKALYGKRVVISEDGTTQTWKKECSVHNCIHQDTDECFLCW